MATRTLKDLFHETLKDIYYAERKILRAPALGRIMGMKDAAILLGETLQEEAMTDETLTRIADGSVNEAALRAA